MAEPDFLQSSTAKPRSGIRKRVLIGTALLAFVLGGGAAGYAIWQGLVPLSAIPAATLATVPQKPVPATVPGPVKAATGLVNQQDALEARAAALAERLDSLDLMAGAAAGNAARAEALLVAFAARRALDRGAPLGLLEDQLRLRFGNSQPNAVTTVIEAAREPVTMGDLVGELDALAPTLTAAPASTGAWEWFKQEVGGLFVIRRESAPSPEPQIILRRAHILLEEGRADEAMSQVRRLPGARDATAWFRAARRYDTARRALDVLETTALIEQRGLRDARGGSVETSRAAPASAAQGQTATAQTASAQTTTVPATPAAAAPAR